MRTRLAERVATTHARFTSLLLFLTTLPLFFYLEVMRQPSDIPGWFLLTTFLLAFISPLAALILQKSRAPIASGMAALSGFFTVLTALPLLLDNPSLALIALIALTSLLFYSADIPRKYLPYPKSSEGMYIYQCAISSSLSLMAIPILTSIFHFQETVETSTIQTYALTIAAVFFTVWLRRHKLKAPLIIPALQLLIVVTIYLTGSHFLMPSLLVTTSIIQAIILLQWRKNTSLLEFWRTTLIEHPARSLFTTFLMLSIMGTIMLKFPISTHKPIDLIDAFFTSISAVCVTGLIVLDTPHDFTFAGQFFILLLIQLGGLGIMAIATVTLHAFGRRLSLKHESTVNSLADTSHNDLIDSLRLVLKYTFAAEALGAFLLTTFFLLEGDSFISGLWRGVFTSISAFCNAGFALQSDSLVPYRENPFILNTIGFLIIAGGLAPSTCLAIPKWLAGKHTPVASKIALITTLVLLLVGTVSFLAFEWDGMLDGLSFIDKLTNAWFQSVTLRTAGFNSLDLSVSASPTFLIMLVMMFIGGSPGGTAGGIKTTTIGILALTFVRNITNHDTVIYQYRKISHTTIYRAITIFTAGLITLFSTALALEITQQIPSRDLVYEAASALATVGLSLGATSELDSIGKVIIIIAMFVGRIGPLTLFMLLCGPREQPAPDYPEAKISLS